MRFNVALMLMAGVAIVCAMPYAEGDSEMDQLSAETDTTHNTDSEPLYYGIEHIEAMVYATVIDTLRLYYEDGTDIFKDITPKAPQYTNEIYPFVLDADTLQYVADGSGLFGVGEELPGMDRAVYNVRGGVWLEYKSQNPDNGEREFKRSWVYEYDGYLFGAGYYTRDAMAQDVVHQAVELYMSKGEKAFELLTPSEVITTADLYAFVVNATTPDLPAVAHGISPEKIGRSATAVIAATSDRPFDDVMEDLRRDGSAWVEYIFRNPDTYTDQLKRTWLYLYDDLIFASGYYLPDSRIQTEVEEAIKLHSTDEGITTSDDPIYTSNPHSFILDASTLETIHDKASPYKVGTTSTYLDNADLPLAEIMAHLERDGHVFVKYLSENPATRTTQLTRSYLSLHEGLIFASGYYFPDSRAVSIADESIQVYKSHRDTVFDTITAGDLTRGDLYPYVINRTHIVAHGAFPHHVGPIPSGNQAEVPGEPGKLLPLRVPITTTVQNAYDEGLAWGETVLPHSTTGIDQVRRSMVLSYDGFVFGAGYYLLDADVQSVVDQVRFMYEADKDTVFDRITPDQRIITHDYYPFILNGTTWEILAHGSDPDAVGECFCDMLDMPISEIQKSLAEEEGVWVHSESENPSVNVQQLSRVWLSAHEGLILGAGYFVIDSMSQTTVRTAVVLYDHNATDTIHQVNSIPREGSNPFYSFIVDPTSGVVLAQGTPSDITDTDWEAITQEYSARELIRNLEVSAGMWVTYDFVNPQTGEMETKHTWLRMHDGHIFGSGYYKSSTLTTPIKFVDSAMYLGHVNVLDPRILSQGREGPDHSFDMVNGNVLGGVVIPHLGDWLHQISPYNNDPALVLRYTTQLTGASFDAVAPYHPTAVGMYSRMDNRPASESETNLLPNTAIMYAVYRFALDAAPERTDEWRDMMTLHDLDPDDQTGLDLDCSVKHDLESPIAIGNHAGKCFVDARRHDGFNQYGYETFGRPMADTTGYNPVNTPHELSDPTRWQPLMFLSAPGTYASQVFITPQFANTATYTGIDPRSIRVPPPHSSNYENMDAYREQADEVLAVSMDLTDEEKAIIEFFDNKRRTGPLAARDASIVGTAQILFLAELTRHDAGVVGWQEKTLYDAIRPVSAIRHLYGDTTVVAPTSVGRDSLEIPGTAWNSYVSTGNHPEYPSVTACLCAAFAEAFRQFTGSDRIYDFMLPDGSIVPGYQITMRAGSSLWEPGITPAEDVKLLYNSWTEFEEECANSRVIAGLHFRTAVDESLNACGVVGDAGYGYWKSLIDGKADMRGPEVPIPPDPLLEEPFWTHDISE